MAGIRNNPIVTGYIPVEYNMYIDLAEKAERFDRMMAALRDYNNKHSNRPRYVNYYERRAQNDET